MPNSPECYSFLPSIIDRRTRTDENPLSEKQVKIEEIKHKILEAWYQFHKNPSIEPINVFLGMIHAFDEEDKDIDYCKVDAIMCCLHCLVLYLEEKKVNRTAYSALDKEVVRKTLKLLPNVYRTNKHQFHQQHPEWLGMFDSLKQLAERFLPFAHAIQNK